MFAALALFALAVEAAVGFPDTLFARIGHPVTWFGALIAWCDRHWNSARLSDTRRRVNGVVTLLLLLAIAAAVGVATADLSRSWLGFIALGLTASALLAQRSLYRHVAAVADALERNGLEAGRRAVAMIVGRDPEQLDAAGVSRAAIESLAENFSDGVVAPLFWLVVAGLPGCLAYKAINTADSMIGHKTARHGAFGWAVARADDLVNLPASRLAALWLVLAALVSPGANAVAAARAVRRDAGKHRSPNAGWPEAAMAGALGLKLAGPRVYGGELVDDHTMGDGRREATAGDIRAALRIYVRACLIEAAVVALLALAVTA